MVDAGACPEGRERPAAAQGSRPSDAPLSEFEGPTGKDLSEGRAETAFVSHDEEAVAQKGFEGQSTCAPVHLANGAVKAILSGKRKISDESVQRATDNSSANNEYIGRAVRKDFGEVFSSSFIFLQCLLSHSILSCTD